MKKLRKLLMIAFVFTSVFAMAQIVKLNEKQVMKKSHIDFSKEVIYFELSGLIEIDGHTFLNDTCKVPVIYTADLDGVTISKAGVNYNHRKCSNKGCSIIHLKPKLGVYIGDSQFNWNGWGTTTLEHRL